MGKEACQNIDGNNTEQYEIWAEKLTKKRIAVILYLYANGEIGHTQLAQALGYSVCSLSNLLSKMQADVPVLFGTRKVGRNKYYALTELGTLFVREYLLPKKEKDETIKKLSVVPQEDKFELEQVLKALENLQTYWRCNWKQCFCSFLDGEMDFTAVSDQILQDVKQMVCLIEKWETRGKEALLERIYSELEEETLIGKVKDVAYRMDGIRLLCELDINESEKAYDVVDGFFDCEGLVGLWSFLKDYSFGIEKEQCCRIAVSLSGFLQDMEHVDDINRVQVQAFYFDGHRRLLRYIMKSYKR